MLNRNANNHISMSVMLYFSDNIKISKEISLLITESIIDLFFCCDLNNSNT